MKKYYQLKKSQNDVNKEIWEYIYDDIISKWSIHLLAVQE